MFKHESVAEMNVHYPRFYPYTVVSPLTRAGLFSIAETVSPLQYEMTAYPAYVEGTSMALACGEKAVAFVGSPLCWCRLGVSTERKAACVQSRQTR